jgi:hypothetical protein
MQRLTLGESVGRAPNKILFNLAQREGLSAILGGVRSYCRVIVQNYIQERVMDLQIAVIFDETQHRTLTVRRGG